MKNLDNLLHQFTDTIKKNSYFENMKIVTAYPCEISPSRLSKVVIAVGISGADFFARGAGEEDVSGNIEVFADIFVPWRMKDNRTEEIFTHICEISVQCGAVSIKADRIMSDKATGCYVLKSVFTFNDELVFGGETSG